MKKIKYLLLLILFINQSLKGQIRCNFFVNSYSNTLITIVKNNFFMHHEVKNNYAITIDSFVINKQSVYLSNRVGEFEIFNLKKFLNKDTSVIKDFHILGSNDFIIDYKLDLIPDTVYEYKKVKIFRFKVYKNANRDSLGNSIKNYNEVYGTYDFIIGYGFTKYLNNYIVAPNFELLCNCNKKYLKKVYKLQKRLKIS